MNIIIKTIADKFLINIESYKTLSYLKDKISEKIKINKEGFRLFYKGCPLLNEKQIHEYDIHDNSIIHLLLTLH